jgi:uncharacterized protein
MFLTILVNPKAKETAFAGKTSSGILKFRVNAVPEDGKANKALLEHLSKILKLAKREIILESGGGSRLKRISIPDQTPLPW